MKFNINLEYTPISPVADLPFTESSLSRRISPYVLDTDEIGIALVDIWNIGWENGPCIPELGYELSTERGISHANRKRQIIEEIICPTVNELRKSGVQIFHCNHAFFLEKYPQWNYSTTQEERDSLNKPKNEQTNSSEKPNTEDDIFPPRDWVHFWQGKHSNEINNWEWLKQNDKVYEFIDIPDPAKPQEGDLLVFHHVQFHRLLTERKIKVLFYMGFETDICVQFSDCGMKFMSSYGYMCNILRDCTTTFEVAETLNGLWKTRVHIANIENKWGYSTTSQALIESIRKSERD
ncbi:isochorismatase family protein [Paenibacillus eucommiae]|uniref:Nicotinamidase-related amidase n=1 Tax=Paenibacillus eucommiae TaxID=1355755 RepID=A0ABS4J3F2_9BACL|nr:isochorismatase family protein [Paenibacillus eucommiae]MBP1994338.1 nicotinamidase-related amidase [Paenibacillus eucommiae]